eukprot:gene12919-14251_t
MEFPLMVRKLSPNIDEKDLVNLFSTFGKVSSVAISRHVESGHSLGLACIVFNEATSVNKAAGFMSGWSDCGAPCLVACSTECKAFALGRRGKGSPSHENRNNALSEENGSSVHPSIDDILLTDGMVDGGSGERDEQRVEYGWDRRLSASGDSQKRIERLEEEGGKGDSDGQEGLSKQEESHGADKEVELQKEGGKGDSDGQEGSSKQEESHGNDKEVVLEEEGGKGDSDGQEGLIKQEESHGNDKEVELEEEGGKGGSDGQEGSIKQHESHGNDKEVELEEEGGKGDSDGQEGSNKQHESHGNDKEVELEEEGGKGDSDGQEGSNKQHESHGNDKEVELEEEGGNANCKGTEEGIKGSYNQEICNQKNGEFLNDSGFIDITDGEKEDEQIVKGNEDKEDESRREGDDEVSGIFQGTENHERGKNARREGQDYKKKSEDEREANKDGQDEEEVGKQSTELQVKEKGEEKGPGECEQEEQHAKEQQIEKQRSEEQRNGDNIEKQSVKKQQEEEEAKIEQRKMQEEKIETEMKEEDRKVEQNKITMPKEDEPNIEQRKEQSFKLIVVRENEGEEMTSSDIQQEEISNDSGMDDENGSCLITFENQAGVGCAVGVDSHARNVDIEDNSRSTGQVAECLQQLSNNVLGVDVPQQQLDFNVNRTPTDQNEVFRSERYLLMSNLGFAAEGRQFDFNTEEMTERDRFYLLSLSRLVEGYDGVSHMPLEFHMEQNRQEGTSWSSTAGGGASTFERSMYDIVPHKTSTPLKSYAAHASRRPASFASTDDNATDPYLDVIGPMFSHRSNLGEWKRRNRRSRGRQASYQSRDGNDDVTVGSLTRVRFASQPESEEFEETLSDICSSLGSWSLCDSDTIDNEA